MLATTTVGPGPISSAPRPVPQGCEQLWYRAGVGYRYRHAGNDKDRRADHRHHEHEARIVARRRSIVASPHTQKGATAKNQRPAQFAGKMPSVICMAWAWRRPQNRCSQHNGGDGKRFPLHYD